MQLVECSHCGAPIWRLRDRSINACFNCKKKRLRLGAKKQAKKRQEEKRKTEGDLTNNSD